MANLTIRQLPDVVIHALRARANLNGRSLQAEVHDILLSAVLSAGDIKLGSLLADIGRQVALTEEELALFNRHQELTDKNPQ